MKVTDELENDNTEKFINIKDDTDLQLMEGANELKANDCLRNVIIDHQQASK